MEDKKSNNSTRYESSNYGAGWQFVENLLARTFWVISLAVVFIIKMLIRVVVGIFQAVKKSKATQTSREQAQDVIKDALKVTSIDEKFQSAMLVRIHEDDEFGWGLVMRLFPDRIERTMKTPTERLSWMRARRAFKRVALPAFTPDIASASGLPFTFYGCIQQTEKELGNSQAFKRKVVVVQDDEPSFYELPTPSMAEPVSNESDFSSPEPQRNAVTVQGLVTEAGVVEITPQRGRPYKTFQVSVRSRDGHESQLSGVDLREKFENGEFGVRDEVLITKTSTKFQVGKQTRTKNEFTVEVTKQGSF